MIMRTPHGALQSALSRGDPDGAAQALLALSVRDAKSLKSHWVRGIFALGPKAFLSYLRAVQLPHNPLLAALAPWIQTLSDAQHPGDMTALAVGFVRAHPQTDVLLLVRGGLTGGWSDVATELVSYAGTLENEARAGLALIEAVEVNNEAAAAALLNRGAPPNARMPKSQITPLLAAASTGNRRIAETLLGAGACVEEVDARQRTVFHRAALTKVGRHLLDFWVDRGADPDARDVDGRTAVEHAATQGPAARAQIEEHLLSRATAEPSYRSALRRRL